MPPQMSRVVMVCPSTRTLRITAETGSSAPRMAVGVEPISWMARVVQASENTVGMIASAVRLSQPVAFVGMERGDPMGIMTKKTTHPQRSTYSSSFVVGMFLTTCDTFTIIIYRA